MKNYILALIFLLCSFTTFSQSPSFGVFDKSEYTARRTKLMEKIPDGIAIIQGAAMRTEYYRFFQGNDFMYLCGLEIPGAVLVIDGVNKESTVFFSINDRGARTEGLPLEHINNTVEVTGIEYHLGINELEKWLRKKSKDINVFYTEFEAEELMRECSMEKGRYLIQGMTRNIWDGRPTKEDQFVFNLKNLFPDVLVTDCTQKIWDLRVIKSPAEIALLRKAGKIGVEAHKAIMKATYVGMPEYELAALFEYENKKRGAQELAYYTIVCQKENHPYVHYHTYDGTLEDGEFLVIDGGPDLHYYDIDITISYPVNGKFTPRQKEIYEACNAMHEACMAVYRPGLDYSKLKPEVMAKLKEMGYDTRLPIFKKFGASFGHYV
ncbi:MAG: aminopeptidase P family protein, partial [Bacteroidetes bacterium]|nr:aminopeptidase P family protein [Bacteroidota bacterium]